MDTDIIQNKIFAHIVGINDYNKDEFIKLINSSKILSKILIIDIDKISEKIMEEKNMNLLLNKINNKESSLSIIKQKKNIEKKMHEYWKAKMDYYINKSIKSNNSDKNACSLTNNKKIILIGYLHFFNNTKIYINLEIIPKFFIKIINDDHVKSIISYNIEKYKDNIINGNFDLNYLDKNFLIKRRLQMQSIYSKLSYFPMTLSEIINIVEIYYQTSVPDVLYFASFTKYDKKIPQLLDYITVYTTEWFALSSIYSNIKKGIKNNQEFIIITKEQYNNLMKSCYIYEINNTENFLPYPNKYLIYKYITYKPIKINRIMHIDNIINQLKKFNINIKIF